VTTHQFVANVVNPKVTEAPTSRNNQEACHAIQSMDAPMGITFWHLSEIR
jgi:hypothetical protein